MILGLKERSLERISCQYSVWRCTSIKVVISMSTTTYLKSTEWTRSSYIPHYQKLNIWIIFILITVRLITAIFQGGNQIKGSPIQGSTALMYKNAQRYKITLDDKIYIGSTCETLKRPQKRTSKALCTNVLISKCWWAKNWTNCFCAKCWQKGPRN